MGADFRRPARLPAAGRERSKSTESHMPLRRITLAASVLVLSAIACASGSQGPGPAAAGTPPSGSGPPAAPAASTAQGSLDEALCAPILIEQDLGFGTHVVMRRLPN